MNIKPKMYTAVKYSIMQSLIYYMTNTENYNVTKNAAKTQYRCLFVFNTKSGFSKLYVHIA